MAVVKTFVENEKTIRVWEESRGNKTLTRKFYVIYRLTKVINGRPETVAFDTLTQAAQAGREWMSKTGNDWRRYNEYCTHIEGTEWMCFDKRVNAKCYISEEGGKRISEVIE